LIAIEDVETLARIDPLYKGCPCLYSRSVDAPGKPAPHASAQVGGQLAGSHLLPCGRAGHIEKMRINNHSLRHFCATGYAIAGRSAFRSCADAL